MFAGLLLPMFSKSLKDRSILSPLIKQSFLLLWAISVLIAFAIASTGQEWATLLYTHSTKEWGHILTVLVLCFIPMSGIYIYGTLLTASGKLKRLNYFLAFGAIFNIVLNLFLIPKYQAKGAAIATLCTQTSMFLGHIILSKKQLQLSWSPEILRKSLLYFSILFVLAYFLIYHTQILWVFKFVILIISGGFASLVLRLIDLNLFVEILRSKQK